MTGVWSEGSGQFKGVIGDSAEGALVI
jgi:hypothetical protein